MALVDVKSIRKSIESNNVVFGLKETVKNVKLGNVSTVYISSNLPDTAKNDLMRYCKISKFKIVSLGDSNEELGVICKKPFSVSVLSVLNKKAVAK